MEVDESPEGLLGRGASGDVKRGWFRGAPVALKSLFLLRTDAASTALLGGGFSAAAAGSGGGELWECG